MSTIDPGLADGPVLADGELGVIAAHLTRAAGPEDVFGELYGTPDEQLGQLRHTYRRLALAVHPDRHANDPVANEAFVTLQRLYDLACEQIQAGQYGQAAAGASGTVVITTRRRAYTVGAPFAEGDLANLYTCTVASGQQQAGGILKVARDPQDNDLLVNEASTLRRLLVEVDGRPVPAYIPRLLESFRYEDGSGEARQINAFPLIVTERGPLPVDQLYTLEEVRQQYQDGADPKQMAWMWRRLLIALGHAHEREVVHGAVLPTHVLIHPEAHGLLLVDWCASVRQPGASGNRIPTISTAYERWYPLAVLARGVPTPAVDLEMGLRCMLYLLGGDPLSGALPASVPVPLQAYLRGALATSGDQLSSTRLYQDFSALLADLWGNRTFVPFSMPARR